ncbi:Gfo/Idh/MocA family oxidoreductase [Metabacillus idriensis]|uniref:Gfo/Idh/MocA family protein n=1 Tax=Metabacillus idriensis TaxID=324768 RepID=UPI002813E0B9|nr:Gfo/Idh/MocA family oxidoreductase [Metabacillus idriensis]MDR0140110.1 Gfo/Idh/MocA family oxidoreductase [Metabacillus idriensis]
MRRVAVVGTGTMGTLHLEAWKKVSRCEVVAVIGRTEQNLIQMTEQFDVKGFKDLPRALEQISIDIVDVCVPTHLHEEVIEIAAQAGKAIICEKPLAADTKTAKRIVDLCVKYDAPLYVGHVLRFSPDYKAARQQVLNGAIGNHGVMRLSRVGPYPKGRDDWYRDESKSGGVLLDLGIHDFDWLHWTFGDVERVMAKRIKRENLEYALVTLRFVSGAIAHLTLSWGITKFSTSFELAGSEGMITYKSSEREPVEVELFNEIDSKQERVAVPSYLVERTPLENQLQHFADCLENKKSAVVTAADAVKAIELVEAALESVKIGQPILLKKGGVLK